MRTVRAVAVSFVSLLLCAASASAGSPDYEDGALEDSLTGSDRSKGPRWIFDAHSDANGQNARGHVNLIGEDGKPLVGEVTCLAVTGNRAVVGVWVEQHWLQSFWIVEDNGPGTKDRLNISAGVDTLGYSCTEPPVLTLYPLTPPYGDLVVGDDQPLPVKAKSSQCQPARKLTAARRKRCAKIRKAKASCIRKARKVKSKAKAQRRVRACRRIAAARSRP